jgi:hypothetical protein
MEPAPLTNEASLSRLEPFSELIQELRRRGRTFREITAILREKFQLRVASNTVVRFVAGQLRRNQKGVGGQIPRTRHQMIQTLLRKARRPGMSEALANCGEE